MIYTILTDGKKVKRQVTHVRFVQVTPLKLFRGHWLSDHIFQGEISLNGKRVQVERRTTFDYTGRKVTHSTGMWRTL